MIINIRLSGEELKEIEDIVLKGEVGSIQEFIRYSIHNQLQVEMEERYEGKNESSLLNKVETTASKNEKPTKRIDLPAINSDNIVSLDSVKIKKRTEKPIWALKNRYFPLKFVLRILQKLSSENNGEVLLQSFDDEIRKFAFLMRTEMEKLDKKLDNKRGSRLSSGFPVSSEESYNRFFNNFVIYISSDGETIKGMPYELGFIDHSNGSIFLTEDGNNFASLYSPILDGYFLESKIPVCQYSNEELTYLYNHIKQKTTSERELFEFILSKIEKGYNSPIKLHEVFKPFLEYNFPKDNGYGDKEANSIRTGLISRLNELKIIKVITMNGKNIYELGKNYSIYKNSKGVDR